MRLSDRLLEHTLVYRLWQSPFAEKKFAPVLARNDFSRVRRVLDVGCGPGTNTHHFSQLEYLGVDINERYIESARQRHHREFLVADITRHCFEGGAFDFIFVNSFLHHVDDESANRILSRLGTLLTEDGHVHVLDLVLPAELSIARKLAEWDRGRFVRPIETWRNIFARHFVPVWFHYYDLKGFGVPLWKMVYFKGRRRDHDSRS